MLVQESLTIDRRKYIKTYSDEGYYIRQLSTGILYEDAIDPKNSGREYEETDQKIPEIELE